MTLTRRLLTWLAPRDLRESLLDDYDEALARDRETGPQAHRARGFLPRGRQSVATLGALLRLRYDRRFDGGLLVESRPPIGSTFARDLWHALRLMRRAPGFTIMAVATLALGIGANSAIFSVVKTVLLEPLPYGHPDRLAIVWRAADLTEPTWLAAPEIESYTHDVAGFANFAAYTEVDGNLTGGDEPERIHTGAVTTGMFDVLGVPALAGRGLEAADADANAPGVIVLGYSLWQRRFGGLPSIVGQSIQINGRARLVVGVMPASFTLPLDYQADRPTDAWVPLVFTPASLQSWGDHSYFGIARLRDGVTPAAATAEINRVQATWPRNNRMSDAEVLRNRRATLPLDAFLSSGPRRLLLVLLAAVGVVLLVACANVVNLLLVRSDARRHEVLVRSALGAERGVLIRQALTESLALSILGAVAGLAVARASLQLLIALGPATLPRLRDVHIDATVLGFTGVVALLAALLFGAGPALQFARANLADALREGGRTQTPGRTRMLLGRGLVIGQLACSVVLIIGAGLLVRTLVGLSRVDLGFDPHGVLTAELALPTSAYPTNDVVIDFYRRLTDRLEALPGVESAGAIRLLPLSRTIGNWSITIEGRPSQPNENPNGDFQWTTPDYFKTIGASIARGRGFTPADREQTPPVVVINQTMAGRYWPNEDAIGRRFKMGTATQPWMTVIGILRDTHHNGVVEAPRAEMYLLHAQLADIIGGAPRGMAIVMRTSGDPLAASAALRAAVRDLDPRLPVANVRTLDAIVSDSLSSTRFAALLLGLFALLALTLSAIGTYGTMSMLVAARRPEIGIRLALGAGRASIFNLIVGHGLALAIAGIAIGVAGALAATRVLGTFLYGVTTLDPLTFLVAPTALAAVALLACATPARRAATVDPIRTIRQA
jgi:putative ABC transport system permease protein